MELIKEKQYNVLTYSPNVWHEAKYIGKSEANFLKKEIHYFEGNNGVFGVLKEELDGLNKRVKEVNRIRAIKLDNFNEAFYLCKDAEYDEIIIEAKRWCYGMDGVGGYNFTDDNKIVHGEVDISLEGTFNILNSFRAINKNSNSILLK